MIKKWMHMQLVSKNYWIIFMNPNNLKVTMRLVYQELQQRGIPVKILSTDPSLVEYQYREQWHLLHSTLGEKEPAIAYAIAENKTLTSVLSQKMGWPHPASQQYNEANASQFLEQYRPLAVKPLNGAHGNGITLGVESDEQLLKAVKHAEKFGKKVLLQQMVSGDDYRVLCIDGRYVAALKRIPACVKGDGIHSVRELIIQENKNPERGSNYSKALEYISLDTAKGFLGESIENIPLAGEVMQVVGVPNLGSGGRAEDKTDLIPEQMIDIAISIAKKLKMGVCGVDFIWDGNDNLWVIEINANPGIDMHDDPKFGVPRGVITALVDYLLV
ncbi:hypothetical protein EOL73_02390 [Candidatus Saccharibacteria bacterium]|nr:hypothetical protein [Candidatus Saccharibacteria bacterium]